MPLANRPQRYACACAVNAIAILGACGLEQCLHAQPSLTTAYGSQSERTAVEVTTSPVAGAAPDAKQHRVDQFRLDPLPQSLSKSRGVHPRLFLSSKRVVELREAIMTTHAALWSQLRALANGLAQRGPPSYTRNDGWSYHEQLWQREVGDQMPTLALAYLLSGHKRYLDAARDLAVTSCGYKTWGLNKLDGVGLAAGHQLAGLAIVYDWCYEDLGEASRRTIRETLVRRTAVMFEASATGQREDLQRKYLDGHMWVNLCGVLLSGLVLFDEVDEASQWIGLPLEKLNRSLDALGPDGASHLGVSYWAYGMIRLMMFMHLAKQHLDIDLWDRPYFHNTGGYLQYLMIPRAAWTQDSQIVDFADCDRFIPRGPDYLLRGLARFCRDEHAQWLAQATDDANVAGMSSIWLNFIWFDPTVPSRPPNTRPTLRWFEDMDIVSARSDWSGTESLVVFKCGPCLGHKAIQQFDYDPGAAHAHPDANHFALFGAGQWLIRDDGYRNKRTGQHNTLLINGRGQLGEGGEWFDATVPLRLKSRPRVLSTRSSPEMDHIVGDATQAYPQATGLQTYVRHLLFVKPDILIVLDDVRLSQNAELELRFHPEEIEAARDENAWLIRGPHASLRVEPLTRTDVEATAEHLQAGQAIDPGNPTMFTIRLRTERSQWRNAVALSWAPTASSAKKVVMNVAQDQWHFRCPQGNVRFSWDTGTASLVP